MSDQPLWRRAFDAVEGTVTPRLESLVRTSHFTRGAALVTRAEAYAREQVTGASARFWHLLNLPAGSDLSRLRAQVGALDREVRRLTLQLEQERRHRRDNEGDGDAARSDSPKRPGPRPARRRTKRPPSA